MNTTEILEAIRSDELREALRYWESRKGDRAMPAREDLDLTDLPRLLTDITIADVVDGGADYLLRYVGRHLSGLQQVQPGVSCLSIPPEQGRDFILKRYGRAVAEKRPVYQLYVYDTASGSGRRVAETLTCPLSDDGVTVNKLFTCGHGLGFAGFDQPDGDTLI
jgi:hypothetical protein